MKEKDNACHMRIELTQERYATLCARAKKIGLRKRTPIVRLLAKGEISGYKNSAVNAWNGFADSAKPFWKTFGTLIGTLLWVSTKVLPLFCKPLSLN